MIHFVARLTFAPKPRPSMRWQAGRSKAPSPVSAIDRLLRCAPEQLRYIHDHRRRLDLDRMGLGRDGCLLGLQAGQHVCFRAGEGPQGSARALRCELMASRAPLVLPRLVISAIAPSIWESRVSTSASACVCAQFGRPASRPQSEPPPPRLSDCPPPHS